MIWVGPTNIRETAPHEFSTACVQHCFSCHLDHHGGHSSAFQWCADCGHAYREPADLKTEYLAEAGLSRRNWLWWRIAFASKSKLRKLVTYCPLCLYDFPKDR